jgi:hypothetical protein
MRTPDGKILTPVTEEEAPSAFPDTTDKDEAHARYEARRTPAHETSPGIEKIRARWND